MKTNTVQRTAEFSADAPLHNVQIAATPQMFQVLSSGIYTHKELAVVRELVSNAWDAHKDAYNENIPITVHLPTAIEPWFSVHDYGTGMRPELVVELYMNYGRSDKQHTDALIGGFGLGSKAPFALTDQFTVISRYNGTKYTFQAFLNNDGAPVCTQLGEELTTDPDGLTVYVPVQDGSLDFERALRNIGKYMNPKPVVEGQPDFDFRNREYGYEIDMGDGIIAKFIQPDNDPFHKRQSDALVVQGIVPYLTEITPDYKQYGYRLELHCPIGTFEPTVSRERIAMNGETHDRLNALINTAYERLYDKLTQQLHVAETWYEWVKLNHRLDYIDRTGTTMPAAYTNDPYVEGVYLDQTSVKSFNLSILSKYTTNCRRQEKCERARTIGRLGTAADKYVRLIPVPRRNAPTRRMATKYFSDSIEPKNNVIFVHGTMHDLTRWADHYGIPHECLEHPPDVATQPAQRTKRMGATKYACCRVTDEDFDLYTATADGVIDDHLEDDHVLILTHKNDARTRYNARVYRSLVRSGDLPDPGSFFVVEVNEGHTKVKEFLTNEHQGEVWDPVDVNFERSTKITATKRKEIADRWAIFYELPNDLMARRYRRDIEALLPDANQAPSLQHLINALENYTQFVTDTTRPNISEEVLRRHSSGTPKGPGADLKRHQDAVANAVTAIEPSILRDLFATILIRQRCPFVLHRQPTGQFPRHFLEDGYKAFVTYINQLLLEDRA